MLKSNDRYRLITLLLKIANSINKDRNAHLRKINLTSRQGDILVYIHDHSDCTMTDLALYMNCTHQTVQEIIKKMIAKHLLAARRSVQDGRYQIIELTSKGRKESAIIAGKNANTGKELLKGMSNQKQKLLLKLLIESFNNLKI